MPVDLVASVSQTHRTRPRPQTVKRNSDMLFVRGDGVVLVRPPLLSCAKRHVDANADRREYQRLTP